MTTQQGFPAKSDTVTRDEPMALASRGLGLHGDEHQISRLGSGDGNGVGMRGCIEQNQVGPCLREPAPGTRKAGEPEH